MALSKELKAVQPSAVLSQHYQQPPACVPSMVYGIDVSSHKGDASLDL